jgi:hypothetical protein
MVVVAQSGERRFVVPKVVGSKPIFHPKNYNVLWCNWQHVGFWYQRVQVRALVGQQREKTFAEILDEPFHDH